MTLSIVKSYFREIMPQVLWLSKPDLVLRRRGDNDLVTLDFKHSVWEFNRSLLAFDRQFVGQAYAAGSKWMIKTFIHTNLPRPGVRAAAATIDIHRNIEPVDGQLYTEWLEETKLMLEPVLEARRRNVFPKRAPRACSDYNHPCPFHELCDVGKIVGQLLIETREKDNPLKYLGM